MMYTYHIFMKQLLINDWQISLGSGCLNPVVSLETKSRWLFLSYDLGET